MNTHHVDFRTIRFEIEARYPQRRRTRRDSSLEVVRRTMARQFHEENDPVRGR